MAGEPGQRIYTKLTQHFPTWKKLLDDSSLYDERHKFFNQLLPSSHALALVPVGAQYWDELTSAQEKVTLNETTPEQALQQVEQRVQSQLQQFCK
jgi:ABC-type glycerol-3-phosphate transport system substrate-binding protein